jgi:LacI family transcriptional regulator
MKRHTIKDIAVLAGVSPSTVSRALKDHPDISLAIREEVKRIADELHYHPNSLAANLRKRRSGVVGLIIPEITMFFFPSVIKAIAEKLNEEGFRLLVLQSNDSFEEEKKNVQVCCDQSVDGLLISLSSATTNVDHLTEARDLGIPVVVFDKSQETPLFDEIIIDDAAVVREAIIHLHNHGCKKIAGLFGNPGLVITQRRLHGFREVCAELNLPFGENTVRFAPNLEQGRIATAELLHDWKPDAIFAMSDELIAGMTSTVLAHHLDIPNDISLIGISDGHLPHILYPAITHMHHDGMEVGRLSAERIVTRIRENDLPPIQRITIQPNLVEGQSVRN